MILKHIAPEDAAGELAELYALAKEQTGTVGESTMMFSHSPELLKQFNQFLGYFMSHPTLSAPLLAAVRVLLAEDVKCKFCIDFNGGLLINYFGWTIEQLETFKTDVDKAPLEEKEKAMIKFIVKGVDAPDSVSEEELEALRKLGWGEGDIFDGLYHGVQAKAIDTLLTAFQVG